MHGIASESAAILDDLGQALAKFLFPPGHGGEPAIAAVPIAHRRIEQHHLQRIGAQSRRQLSSRIVIRHLELDRPETGDGRRFETLEKGQFTEQVMQVGGKLRHLFKSSLAYLQAGQCCVEV